ncbi:hypothetical protein F8144_05130 [Streptomyces triticiradicis]|uniref:Uncharacterized protein n=1 Tax=Streptomyces triticiradicis TaxID=2651189 RepID=A0A7J5DLZ1_9ACTN|nr:hypothetical protein F8144_05130 [Streptomyces triticiradicis]
MDGASPGGSGHDGSRCASRGACFIRCGPAYPLFTWSERPANAGAGPGGTPRPCRQIPACPATPGTPPSSSSRGTPTRRTGRKPKYAQYEGFRPALPQALRAGGTPRARSPELSASLEQGRPPRRRRAALRATTGM